MMMRHEAQDLPLWSAHEQETTGPTEMAIELLSRVWPDYAHSRFKPNSCILATRIAIDSLRPSRIHAVPLVVRVRAWNAMAIRHLETGRGDLIGTDGEACGVGLGFNPQEMARAIHDKPLSPTDSFNGHVVAFIPRGGYMLDLTIGQVNRPEKGILVSPFWTQAPEFRRPRGKIHVRFPNGNGVSYEAQPERTDYKDALDWHADRSRWHAKEIRRLMYEAAQAEGGQKDGPDENGAVSTGGST